jgi:Spy/CpxP family protein refolding chaperone
MTLRSKQLLSAWVGMILILTVASAASAGRFGRSGMPFMGKGLTGLKTFIELNLTENQKADALRIIDGFTAFRGSKKGAMQEARANMKTVVQAETFNEEQAREAFRMATALREDLFVQRVKMMSELKAILSPEQLELLKQKRTERQAKFKKGLLSRLQDNRQ